MSVAKMVTTEYLKKLKNLKKLGCNSLINAGMM